MMKTKFDNKKVKHYTIVTLHRMAGFCSRVSLDEASHYPSIDPRSLWSIQNIRHLGNIRPN